MKKTILFGLRRLLAEIRRSIGLKAEQFWDDIFYMIMADFHHPREIVLDKHFLVYYLRKVLDVLIDFKIENLAVHFVHEYWAPRNFEEAT